MSGLVSLVGAGCAPGLITLLGAQRLRECEAVVYDGLVPPETLRLAPDTAERIYVGKRAGRPSPSQEEINALLLRLAAEGRRVVRLKGGDPFVFGRGGEELMALNAGGAACELVPGVTSAVAVPALAGIPLTHRALSRGFAVVTARTALDGELPEYFGGLADFPGTLVVLMGLGRLGEISARLTAAGMDAATPCAVASEGAAGYCIRGRLSDIAALAADAPPPAVVVIGEAAALDLSPRRGLPLAGRSVALTGTRRMNEKLASALSALGAEPFAACELELRPLPAADETPTGCGCLAFTSAEGVRLYFERLARSGRDARDLAGTKLACVGRATAAALLERSLRADLVPEAQTTAALAGLLLSELPEGTELCLYHSAQGDAALAGRLAGKFRLRDIRAYAAFPGGYTAPRAQIEAASAFAFTSAAGAALAIEQLGPIPAGALLAALGWPTAKALRGLPNRVAVAAEPSAEALAKAIAINIT